MLLIERPRLVGVATARLLSSAARKLACCGERGCYRRRHIKRLAHDADAPTAYVLVAELAACQNPLSQPEFVAVATACAKRGRQALARQAIHEMARRGHQPSIAAHAAVLDSYARSSQWERCLEVCREMEQRRLVPDEQCYTAVLRASARSANPSAVAKVVLEQLASRVGVEPPSDLARLPPVPPRAAGTLAAAPPPPPGGSSLSVLPSNPLAGLSPSAPDDSSAGVEAHAALAAAVAQGEGRGLRVVQQAIATETPPVRIDLFRAVLQQCARQPGRAREVQRIVDLLERWLLRNPSTHTERPVALRTALVAAVEACCRSKDGAAASDMLQRMAAARVPPCADAYAAAIRCYAGRIPGGSPAESARQADPGRWTAARQLFDRMLAEGVTPNAKAYNALLDVCKQHSASAAAAAALVRQMPTHGVWPDVHSYCSVLRALALEAKAAGGAGGDGTEGEVRERIRGEARDVLEAMQLHGVAPNTKVFNLAIDVHAESGRTDEVRRLLRQMEEARVPRDHVTWKSAIKACAKAADSRLALELVDRLEAERLRSPDAAELLARGEGTGGRRAPPPPQWLADVYVGALLACSRAAPLGTTLHTLARLRDAGYSPPLKALTAALRACAHHAGWREAMELLLEVREASTDAGTLKRAYGHALKAVVKGSPLNWRLSLALLEDARASGAPLTLPYAEEVIEKGVREFGGAQSVTELQLALLESRGVFTGVSRGPRELPVARNLRMRGGGILLVEPNPE